MKKYINVFIFFFILIFIVGCTKDIKIDSNYYSDEKEIINVDFNSTLNINSADELKNYINGGFMTRSSVISSTDGFVSLNDRVISKDPNLELTKELLIKNEKSHYLLSELTSQELLEITFAEVLGYDELVPNENFAQLLNVKGEIIVDNTLYRITDAGTFCCPPEKQEYLEQNLEHLASKINEATMVSEDKYEIEPGIYLFDTFMECEESEDSTTYNYPELDEFDLDDLPGSLQVQTRSTYDIPGVDNFPRFKNKAKTKVGKLIGKAFGDNSWKKVKMSRKRRFRGKLYDYNYGVYKEIGAVCQMQKKNWIGWSGTKANELVLSWRNVVLELRINVPPLPATAPKYPIFGGVEPGYIPGWKKNGYIATILNLDINDVHLKQAIKLGEKALFSYIKGALKADMSQMPDAYIFINRGKSHLLVVDQDIRKSNSKKMRKVFDSDIPIFIKIDLFNIPSNVVGWAKAIVAGGNKVPIRHLVSGEVVMAGKLSDNWAGMVIYKDSK